MPLPDNLPAYKDLPVKAGAPPHSSWGVFGDDDQIGTVNLITPEKALEAARLVRTGKSFSLNWDLEEPRPAMFGRGTPRHTILGAGYGRDDVLDNFFPQSSSQWDGLTHIRHPEYDWYNGVTAEQITGREGTRNGIEHWARRGMVTRGVLLDVARYLASQGRPIGGTQTVRFSVEDLEATRRACGGVELRRGDILLVRSGWMAWYLQATQPERQAALGNLAANGMPGLRADEAMLAYLWDHGVAAVASDNVSLEAWPMDPSIGSLHRALIPLLGMPIGEMFYLEALAADCATDGVYEFMLTSAPLNILGGVGSPPNAIAIK
jgi:hypothetical protein